MILKPTIENCAAIIPCLNEARTIRRLVSELMHLGLQVIVVDDGSSDETCDEAETAGATVVKHTLSAGKGAALRAGFTKALALGYTWAVALDGDGQHQPGDIPALIAKGRGSGASLVVGNRMRNARTMPWVRRRVNRWMSARLSRFCGADWPDTQCGLRLLNLRSWAQMSWRADHFEIESELLVRFAAAGHRIEFVPIQTIYRGEPSRIRPLRDAWRWFVWWRAIQNELPGATGEAFAAPPASAPVETPIAA